MGTKPTDRAAFAAFVVLALRGGEKMSLHEIEEAFHLHGVEASPSQIKEAVWDALDSGRVTMTADCYLRLSSAAATSAGGARRP